VALEVDVLAHVRGQARDVLVADGVAGRRQPIDGVVEVDGVPQRDRVEDRAEGAELVSMPSR